MKVDAAFLMDSGRAKGDMTEDPNATLPNCDYTNEC